MALAEQDIREIESLINQVIDQRPEVKNANVRYEIDLRERATRVEEELKHQRDLMLEGFKRMDERFEQVKKRFEESDKRFELMQQEMNRRFEQVDKRFEQVDKRFEQVDKRFEQVDKRFEQMEKRFEQVDRRFEQLTTRIDRFMVWSFGTTVSVGGVVIAAIKLL
ncbi:MAG: hypothetical protein RQ715_00560 [Methylococcales bacterium]|nr:hypothetical protein [Methylococcales bacterium]